MSLDTLSPGIYTPGDYIIAGLQQVPADSAVGALKRMDDPANPIPEPYRNICNEVAYRATRMYGEPGKYEEGEVAYLRGLGCAAVIASRLPNMQPFHMADAPLYSRSPDMGFFTLMTQAGQMYADRPKVRETVDSCAPMLDMAGEHIFLTTHGLSTGLWMAELGKFQHMQQRWGKAIVRNTEKWLRNAQVDISRRSELDAADMCAKFADIQANFQVTDE